MALRLLIAIIAIIHLLLSFVPGIFYISFNDYSSTISPIYFVFTIFSTVIFIILLSLVFLDSLKRKGMTFLAFFLVLFLSSFGALLYLFITKNLAKSDYKKVNKEFGLVSKMDLDSILKSPSYINVSNVDKEMIKDLHKNDRKNTFDATPFKPLNFFKPADESNVAYYKNGKAVYRDEVK
ncbi:MAG TPA: hypothetical protein PKK60_03390 [archaeon]|nr:hypothetical protein [archaeon]